jgi:hypothetical protein
MTGAGTIDTPNVHQHGHPPGGREHDDRLGQLHEAGLGSLFALNPIASTGAVNVASQGGILDVRATRQS